MTELEQLRQQLADARRERDALRDRMWAALSKYDEHAESLPRLWWDVRNALAAAPGEGVGRG